MIRGKLATPDGAPPRWLGHMRLTCALLALAVALIVLAGWAVGSTSMTSFGGYSSMRPWAALAIVLAACAMLSTPEPLGPRPPITRTLLVLACLAGVAGLIQFATQSSFGVGELFPRHPQHDVGLYSSPQISTEMVFFGLAQLGPKTRFFSWVRGVSMALFLVIVLIFTVALVFGANDLMENTERPGISAPGAVAMCGLGFGLMAVRARSTPIHWMWQRSLTGTFVRRLLPAMAALPIVLASVIMAAHDAGWFEVQLAVALLTVLMTAAGVALVALTATVVRRSERHAQRAAEHSRALMDSAPDATVLVDATGTILYANAQTTVLLGYLATELVGRSVEVLVPNSARAGHQRLRQGYVRNPSHRAMGVTLELAARHRDGHEIPVEISLGPVPTVDGTNHVAAIRDVSEKRASQIALREAQERFRILAEQDDLTGLSNRRKFEAELEHHLRGPNASSGALIFLDLDHFKGVNDTLGHRAGDQLLILVAEAMASEIPADALLARQGGDEFLALLRSGDALEAQAMSERLVESVGAVMRDFGTSTATVSASAGIAAFAHLPPEDHSATTAMIRADLALYAAKAAGRNQSRVWLPTFRSTTGNKQTAPGASLT